MSPRIPDLIEKDKPYQTDHSLKSERKPRRNIKLQNLQTIKENNEVDAKILNNPYLDTISNSYQVLAKPVDGLRSYSVMLKN